MIVYTGPFRLHFNRKEESPRLASITAPDHSWEIICKSATVEGDIHLDSGGDLNAVPMSPIWWLFGIGRVTVDADGHATIGPLI